MQEIAAARGLPPADAVRSLRLAAGGDRLRLGIDDAAPGEQVLPLLGVATPFDGGAFRHVELAGWMADLPAGLLRALAAEAARLRGEPP